MQPYIFPYIGYFQLMNMVDQWVIFDDIQFIDKGWVNRNRILHPDISKQWQYITIPLKNRGQFDKINEISINDGADWRTQILGKMTFYKQQRAPFYKQTFEFIEDCFQNKTNDLGSFLSNTLKRTAKELGITCKIDVQSEMHLELGKVENAGQWALRIAQAAGADQYINPHGGIEIFNPQEYTENGINLQFAKPVLRHYKQRREEFVPGLSILDVMMWNSPEEIRLMLDQDYNLYSKDQLLSLTA
jgi:hypothetical protein